MQQPSDQLPFNEKKQNALLGHTLVDDKFFRICKDRLKAEWFSGRDGEARGKIWTAKVNFFKRLARAPSHDELKETPEWLDAPSGERVAMARIFIEAINIRESYKIDALAPELDTWMHSRLFTEGFLESEALFNAGKLDEAYSAIESRLKSIRTTNFRGSVAYDFSALREHAARRQEEVKHALTFGSEMIDRLLLPQGKSGGLLCGDTTIVLAPTNIGKTTCKLTVAAANLRLGKSVLIVTHEGVDDDIAEKLVMSLLNVDRTEYYRMCASTEPTDRRYIDSAMALLTKYAKYLPMNKGAQNVETVISAARQAQDERIASTGKGFDLFINDYPAKLLSENMKYAQFAKRNLDEYIYDQFVQLALECKFHCLLAIQANRTGSKINRGQKGFEERLLTMEDVNESYGPMQIATNVITLNRDPWSEANDWITYYISKSRSSEKGWAVVCKSKYAHAITHSNSLGGFWYKGTLPVGPLAEVFYAKYRDSAVGGDVITSLAATTGTSTGVSAES